MHKDLKFFESGLLLIKGDGHLKVAIGELVQFAAEAGSCEAASLFIAMGHASNDGTQPKVFTVFQTHLVFSYKPSRGIICAICHQAH
jgi:hypothetical protein